MLYVSWSSCRLARHFSSFGLLILSCRVRLPLRLPSRVRVLSSQHTVLVSRLHPKDKVTQAYPNSTKDERSVEIVVLDRGSHPIHRESKLVVVFNHPPHGDLQEGFECWTIQRFVKVVSEGNEEDLFDVPVAATAQEQAQQPSNENTDGNNNTNNNNDDEQQDMPDELH